MASYDNAIVIILWTMSFNCHAALTVVRDCVLHSAVVCYLTTSYMKLSDLGLLWCPDESTKAVQINRTELADYNFHCWPNDENIQVHVCSWTMLVAWYILLWIFVFSWGAKHSNVVLRRAPATWVNTAMGKSHFVLRMSTSRTVPVALSTGWVEVLREKQFVISCISTLTRTMRAANFA